MLLPVSLSPWWILFLSLFCSILLYSFPFLCIWCLSMLPVHHEGTSRQTSVRDHSFSRRFLFFWSFIFLSQSLHLVLMFWCSDLTSPFSFSPFPFLSDTFCVLLSFASLRVQSLLGCAGGRVVDRLVQINLCRLSSGVTSCSHSTTCSSCQKSW